MRKRFKWQYICGAAVTLVVVALMLVVFSLLGITDRVDLYLADYQNVRHGWRYELLIDGQARPYEPVFEEDGFTLDLPEQLQAVRITRTLTEDLPNAELEWTSYDDRVEVKLDGKLLYTDFPQLIPDAEGFVHPEKEQWDQSALEGHHIRMSLPQDYVGKELSATTYFPPDSSGVIPEYPTLCTGDSNVAQLVVVTMKDHVVITIYALLALLMAGMFLLDIYNGSEDGKMLLLCLYFLLLFLNKAYNTNAGYYSVLVEWLDLRFLRVVYMAPLYLYLAMRITSRWKWPLSGCILLWALYDGVQEFLHIRADVTEAYLIGPGVLVIFLAVTAPLCVEGLRRKGKRTRQEKKSLFWYGIIAVAVMALYLLNRFRVWGGAYSYLVEGIWIAILMGNFGPLVSVVTDITSYVTMIVVVSEVIRRTLRTRQTMDVLRDRTLQTMESYEHLLAAEDATNALHHEMRHHMTALSAILDSGDPERARRYVDAVVGELERLPTGRYSQNVLVNVVAGSYLERARAQLIRVEHRLDVPPELHIADEDLSVYLNNMLQNALEACRRMAPEADRYIKVDMHQRGNFLFIRCVNSMADDPEEERESRPGHGYGLAAMRSVAEKYNSVLEIKRSPGEFLVMSNLCLPENCPDGCLLSAQ